ncbi:arsenite methyltransferase-like [Bufo bufo]|uniref:arsenite methyltransferase-like n=1 Tax=Bufo bufo TaxID=8384 RepID=UPI001ABE4612|nr:arsenite methyltransferase-like [Bufo bufo]
MFVLRSLTEASCGSNQTHEDVKHYYGKHLSNTKDIKTSACAAPAKPLPKHIKDALSEIHEDITSRYYGCGLTVPQCLENCRILDLGSGSGRDCYILSKLVGPKGHVTGVDMTDEQLELSRKYIDYHTQKFGFQQPNVNFTKGYIENLKEADLLDETFDVVVSNCVINLCADKKTVLKEVYRVLKNGGEMFFSDMYINKTLSEELKKNKMVWGEGIGGALLWKDLFKFAEEIGFSPPRLVTSRNITFNKELEDVASDYKLVSATFRLFKLPKDANKEKCQAMYKGGVIGYENEIQFDVNFSFKEGQAVDVDEELQGILKISRFEEHFSFLPLENALESNKLRF